MQALSRIFNVRPEEWRRLSILSVMALLPVLAGIWAQITLTALFLVQVGVRFIPFIFIGDAIVVVLTFAVYSAFADRFSHAQLLVGLASLGAVGVALGLILIQIAPPAVSYSFLYLLHRIVYAVIGAHWGIYVNSFYDTRAAKRIFSVLASVVRIAGILAALSVPLLNSLFSSDVIIVLWGLSLLALALLARLMPYLVKEPELSRPLGPTLTKQRISYVENIREGFGFVRQSSYLRGLALMSILMMVLATVTNYQVLRIFDNAYKGDQAAIANLISIITLAGNLIMLPIQIFMFSRLVSFLGVGKTNLIYPVTSLGISGLIALFPLQLVAGVLAHFNLNTVNVGIRATNDELLYNAVPVRIKARARGFINGFVEPFGTLLAAMIAGLPFISERWFLTVVLVGGGIAYLLAAIIVSRQYARALILLLEQESFSFLLHATTSRVDKTTLNHLKSRIEESTDNDATIVMTNILIELDGNHAVPVLEKLARRNDPDLQAGILELMVEAKLHASENFYLDLLHHTDPRVQKSALIGLEHQLGRNHERYLQLAFELLNSKETSIRSQALSVLINDPRYQPSALLVLKEFLTSNNPDWRVIGVHILGQTQNQAFFLPLFDCLQDSSNSVRIAAALSIESLAARWPDQLSAPLNRHIARLLQDPIERVRVASIRALGYIAKPSVLSILVPVLDDPSPHVRDAAVEVLARAGKPALLDQTDTKMASVVLARIDPRRYTGLILNHVKHNLAQIYANFVRLDTFSQLNGNIELLRLTWLEQNRELMDEAFYLLSALHDKASLQIIADSLKSDNPRVYANAVEALESLVPAPVARLLVFVFDPALSIADRAAIGQQEWHFDTISPAETIKGLLSDSDNVWLQLTAIFILGEIGAELAAKQKGPKSKQDLLGKLSGTEIPPESRSLFRLDEIQTLLSQVPGESEDLKVAVRAAQRLVSGQSVLVNAQEEGNVLSVVEKIIFLKEVPFFEDMTISQLKVLANVCYEEFFSADSVIFDEGAPGGTLYVVVSGKVGIERKNNITNTSVRLKTVEMRSYFGESTLFDNSETTTTAIALEDTLALRLSHEPLVALIQENPELSLQLIKVLSKRIQQTDEQVADLSRQRSRAMHKVYDKLD